VSLPFFAQAAIIGLFFLPSTERMHGGVVDLGGCSMNFRIPSIPPLETGDHLTRDEFERRYEAMPNLKKAELIEGVVYMPSPVRFEQHGNPQAGFITWLGVYWAWTPGVRAGDNSTLRLDLDTEPQPDALLIIEPTHGGQATIDEDGYIVGGPEMVGEISASSASLDLNAKLRVYRRNNIREYVVWRVLDRAVDWFILHGSQYDPLPLAADGLYHSETFPGLWLDPAALTRLDLLTVLQQLQQGIASPEHAAFVARLRQNAASNP
jgi:Uma2 family endonuclease